jgi:hypothetical protein
MNRAVRIGLMIHQSRAQLDEVDGMLGQLAPVISDGDRHKRRAARRIRRELLWLRLKIRADLFVAGSYRPAIARMRRQP